MFAGAIPWTSINTENSVIRGSKRTGHKPPFLIIVNLQVPDEAGQASFCVTTSKREKVGTQQIISYMIDLIMVDMGFS